MKTQPHKDSNTKRLEHKKTRKNQDLNPNSFLESFSTGYIKTRTSKRHVLFKKTRTLGLDPRDGMAASNSLNWP